MNQILSILYFDPLDKKFIPVDRLHIPLIQNSTGKAYSYFIFKNTSKDIINNIVFSIDVSDFSVTTNMVVKRGGLIPSPSEYEETMSDTYATNEDLEILHPGESIGIFVTAEATGHHVLIDSIDLALDITYQQSYIAVSNMVTHFEYTESREEVATSFGINDPDYEIIDSIDDVVGTVTDGVAGQNIVGGYGYAKFRDLGDKIISPITLTNVMTMFLRAIFHATDYVQQIVKFDTCEIGLDENRKIFVRVEGDEIKTIDTLEDVYGEHIIGVSMKGDGVIISLDGKILEFDTPGILPVFPTPTAAELIDDGSNTINADIFDFIVYDNYKAAAFHKHVALRL